MSNSYKRLKTFLHSTFNHDTPLEPSGGETSTKEDVYTFQPLKMCLEYKSDVKKAMKYPNKFPMPRSGHRIVCNSQYVISYGGYNPRSGNSRIQSDELYKEIWKFDTVRKQWRLLDVANTPPYAASNCCNLIGNKILTIFGGTSYPFGEESGNDLYVLDLNEEKKFNIVTGGEKDENEKPPGRYGQGVVIKDNYLYAIGGTTGYVYSMDVHRLNLSANRWELLYNSDLFGPGDPEPRYRHEVVLYEDHIYVLGGGTELKVFNLQDIHSYDTLSRTWVLHHTNPDPIHLYPSPRKCHGLVQLPSTPSIVYILGGADGALVLNDVWRLDLARLQWTKIEMSLTARVYFHAVYMFGGITRDRDTENTGSSSPDLLERTADLYSVYLTIPCLQEISLEAVKYYHRRRVYNETLCASYGIQFE
ncbi:hypothetical protein M8J76_014743 [Diaphorina citri]|nr:hypothetical protein M8J76_014743 [Diaphorina citri]